MTQNNKILATIIIALYSLLISACDEIPQQANSVTSDGQNLSYDYFINNNVGPAGHANISALLAVRCGASTCHGVGGGNGGTFKVYNPADSDAKNISNFISAQAHVIKGPEDTAPTVITNNYPQAHTSPILKKPLAESAGGIIHKGNVNIDLFVAPSEVIGDDYGEIYRWIAFDQP
ncbi:MAG: hypothetical protein ACC653_00075 [Gammaproteobacteria bacterium]